MTANVYLESCLAPLAGFLAGDDVTDIYINRPREIWVERQGGIIERHERPELDATLLMRLARQVAAVTAQGINRQNPILSAVLPTGERIQVVIPPATRGEIAMAIRKHGAVAMSLDGYLAKGAFVNTRMSGGENALPPVQSLESFSSDPSRLLREAVRQRRNILISGGTSTGKTTFLNALLAEVPREERLILIEDSAELRLEHPNGVGLLAARSTLAEAGVTAEDLLIASLRMRPDRIILGEIRGSEAATFLRAVNTGHPGSLTTVHADSPLRALDQLTLLVLQSGLRMNWDDVHRYVRQSLGIIVQLARTSSGREVAEVKLLKQF